MKIKSAALLGFVLFVNLGIAQSPTKSERPPAMTTRTEARAKLVLSDGWTLQSLNKVPEGGDVLSTARFQAKDWYAVNVPTTVFAALIKNKVYPDPGFGMNLRQVPGVTYPIGGNFSNIEMEPDSPYATAWW